MTLVRGFKKYAQELAQEVRAEMGLIASAPLDPWRLAEHLAVPYCAASELADAQRDAVLRLAGNDGSAFSAFVVCDGPWKGLVYNDAHALTRQRSNIAHELAHALLLHQPTRLGTELHYEPDQEEEAAWLGSVLLVPDAACLVFARRGMSDALAAAAMGVSTDLMRWRMNASGARRRIARADARRAAV